MQKLDKPASAPLNLLGSALGPIAVMTLIYVLPKTAGYANPIRLCLTALFFLSALWLLWAFTTPFEDYLRDRLSWRYESAGPAITMTVTKVHLRYRHFSNVMAQIGMVVITSIGLDVLSSWPALAFLDPLKRLFHLGWLAGFAVMAVVLFRSRRDLSEILALKSQLRDQVAIAGFTVKTERPPSEGQQEAAAGNGAISVTSPGRFRAGEIEWDLTDFYQNLIVFGKPGSGKTLCVLNALLDGLIRSTADMALPPAGLLLDPKGDYKKKIRSVMQKAGREDDLIVFGPGDASSIYWNPFDTEDDAHEVANRFGAVFDVLGRGSEDAYFITQGKLFIQACLTVIRLTKPGEPPAARDFIKLMNDKEELIAQLDIGTKRLDLTELEYGWWQPAFEYLNGTWMQLGQDTLGSVISTLSSALFPLMNPPYDKMMGSKSSISVGDAIDSGKILYVDFKVAERGAMARIACTLLKAEYSRQILLREGKERPSFFFCDEFQTFFSSDKDTSDAAFFERSRGSNHANIIATQNYPALLKGRGESHEADNLVGNCGSLVFLRNLDIKTNEWASKVLSDRLEVVVGTSEASGTTTTSSSSYAPRVRPGDFIGLAQPQLLIGRFAEAISLVSSRQQVVLTKGRWYIHPL